MGANAEPPEIEKSLISISPKIKTPVQLAAFVAGVLTISIAAVLAKNAPFHAVGVAGLGILFIAFGQVFAQLDKLPENSRVSFLIVTLVLFIFAFALSLTSAGFLIWNSTRRPPGNPSPYPPAEQKLVDLGGEMDKIRAVYVSLQDRPEKAPDVNRQARQLAQRMLAVDDAALRPGLQIYKYEAVGYSWAMVTGSEFDPKARLRAVAEILKASDKGNSLIEQAMHPSLMDDKKSLDLQDWIIKDNALPRLQRLTAIALCARSQINRDQEDRKKVRKLIDELPYDYVRDEKPQTSSELQPCLVGYE